MRTEDARQDSVHSPALPSAAEQGATGFPFALLVIYFLVEYGRIHDYVPGLKSLRPGLVLAVLLLLVWVIKGDKFALRDPIVRLYVAFLVLMATGFLYAVNTFWLFQYLQVMTVYLLAGVLPIVAFLSRPRDISSFLRILLVIQVFMASMSILRGGTGTSSFLSDENDLALAINMAIPYAYFLWKSPYATRFKKTAFLGCLAVLVIAVVTSGSRGGFLGLIAVLGAIVLMSRQRIRNFIIIGLGATIALLMVPESYIKDMRTISDQEDPTRLDRVYSWGRGWEMFLDNPVLGVGSGNFPWRFAEYELKSPTFNPDTMRLHGGRAAHSLYFTLLPETGIVGTALYAAILVLLVRRLKKVIEILPGNPADPLAMELQLLATAALASLAGLLVSGAFISVLYYPQLWYMLGFAIALERSASILAVGRQGSAAHEQPVQSGDPVRQGPGSGHR